MLPALCRSDAHKPMNTSRLDQLAERMGEIPEKVLAGFSGGCDSTALVLLLLKRKVSVTCVHVHHGLRGEEADADEAFVRAFCEQHAIPLLVYHAKPPVNPGEGWAREARYAFFRMAMQQTGAQALVLAQEISNLTGIPVCEDALRRIADTLPMKNMTPAERQNNLKKAFQAFGNDVELNSIMLIDDIYTTGATMDACAHALYRRGARRVCFITLAAGEDSGF